MAGWAYFVLGEAKSQGSKKFVGFAKSTGRPIMKEEVDNRSWRDRVTGEAPPVARPLDGPLVAWMVFTVRRPGSARKRDVAPFTSPDLSKLCRAVEDSVTDAGLWRDDGRVCEYARLAKVWWGYDEAALPTPGVIVAAVERAGDWQGELSGLVRQCRADALVRIRGGQRGQLWDARAQG